MGAKLAHITALLRLAILSLTALFALVTLALSGHLLSISARHGTARDVEGLGVAVGVLAVLALGTFLALGLVRKGTFLTWNVVELPVLGFLLILWLAESAIATLWTGLLYPFGCGAEYMLSKTDQSYCNELYAVEGIGFVSWLLLLGYVVTIITLCIIHHRNTVWKASASEAFVHSPHSNSDGEKGAVPTVQAFPVGHASQQADPSMQMAHFPPQQQQGGPQQQYPQQGGAAYQGSPQQPAYPQHQQGGAPYQGGTAYPQPGGAYSPVRTSAPQGAMV